MSKLIYLAIASLDGYIEDEHGKFSWAAPDEEVHAFINDVMRPIATFLYGRRMYETMRASGSPGREPALHRIDHGFAPFCKQLRHVVCVRGVYNAALATGRVDWTQEHDHYAGPLNRAALLTGLDDQQRRLLAILETVRPDRLGRNALQLRPVHLGVRATIHHGQ